MHIGHLIRHADWFADVEHILLIHFSPRYRQSEIREHLAAKLPEQLRRKCTAFLEGFAV
jgi:ribonuclease BN (tRNA processing enzyme)